MKKIPLIFLIPCLGIFYFCQPNEKVNDKVKQTEQPQQTTQMKSGELTFDEYKYPFAIAIPMDPASTKQSTMGDCDSIVDEYLLENDNQLFQISLDCGDYGKNLKYIVLENGQVSRYHEKSASLSATPEESKYIREETFYMPLDTGDFQKVTRKDTTDYEGLSSPMSANFELSENSSKEDLQLLFTNTIDQ